MRNFVALLASVVTLASCQTNKSTVSVPGPRSSCMFVPGGFGPTGSVDIKVQTVVTGLEVPWAIGFLPNGDWLVNERPGRVRLVQGGKLASQPVVSLDVADSDDGGLLGIAISPTFAEDRSFYVYATFQDTERYNRVLRYKLSEDHRTAELDKVIFDRIPGATFHDGGRLRFGPDGMLYIGTGDARDPDRAQSLASPNGKLLRVQPDGSIPSDNPFPNSPVYLLGIRNAQGFDWLDERMIAVADHGPTGELGREGHDEVTVALPGVNLGWPTAYGCEDAAGKLPPSITWRNSVPPGGASFYTGGKISEWTGSLLVGTLASKHLHRLAFNPRDPWKITMQEVYLSGDPPTGYGRLREVVMGNDAELYVTTSNCDGRGSCPPDKDRILRITR